MSNPLISPGYAQARKFGVGPDFTIYTGAMKTPTRDMLPESDRDRPIVFMRGSSTVQDLQGDIMTLSALQDMTHVDSNLTIFLNHSYDLPDDVYGKLYGAPKIEMQSHIADLWLGAEAVLSNPAAEKTYNLIVKDKLRLGCSIGCQVLDWSFSGDEDDWNSPVLIHHVLAVEWSIVGVPASQRCWVENAIKGIFARSLIEGNDDDALRLAPAFKGLYPKDFASVVEQVTSAGLRKEMQRLPMRSTHPQKIMYDFTESKEGFVLSDNKGLTKSLTRDETSSLLESGAPLHHTQIEEPEEMKAASGKTSWPLMDIGTEWTGSKAESQIFAWAKSDDGEIAASKAKQCFLYYDPANSDKQSGYKLPFCYVSGGSPKIVPLGVRAVANVLSGGRGGASIGGDSGAIKGKVKTLYGRINSQFNPDPKWVVPWEKEDAYHPGEEEEEGEVVVVDKQAQKAVEVSSDGKHAAFTGTHAHSHKAYGSQGDDETHSHDHTHDGDSIHDHSHAAETKEDHIQPDKIADAGQVHTPPEMIHDPMTGTHSHLHQGYGASDADEHGNHAHGHVHDGDNHHTHAHAATTLSLDFSERTALLGVYNDIGKKLGFPEHNLSQKCSLVDSEHDAQIVRSMVSAIDDCSDACLAHATRMENYVDSLMGILGVPDTNDTVGGEGGGTPLDTPVGTPGYYNVEPDTTKEGREVSAANRARLQSIHDAVRAMHPDACKGVTGTGQSHQSTGTTVEEAREQAASSGQGQPTQDLQQGIHALDILAKSFDGFNLKGLAGEVDTIKGAIAETRKSLELLNREQEVLLEQVGKLKNMPLGRPTQLNRTVVEQQQHDDRIASYDEMAMAGTSNGSGSGSGSGSGQKRLSRSSHNLEDVLEMTSIVEVLSPDGKHKSLYRKWPQGIGTEVRPPLTNDQKSMMVIWDISNYRSGAEDALVPMVDDPAEILAKS